MKNNPFFNPSPLYKEFMLLDVIEKDPSITQRRMSSLLNVAVSMINEYIVKYEAEGYIKRHYQSVKKVSYEITHLGKERRKLLNIWYLDASQLIYNSAKQNILQFLKELDTNNYKNLLLYGAGEVAEIFLQVIKYDRIDIHIRGVMDDDTLKQGLTLLDVPVISFKEGIQHSYDGILVSTYGYHTAVREKCIKQGIPENKILGFF